MGARDVDIDEACEGKVGGIRIVGSDGDSI